MALDQEVENVTRADAIVHCTLYIVHWVIKWLPVMLEVRLTCRLQFLFDLFQKKVGSVGGWRWVRVKKGGAQRQRVGLKLEWFPCPVACV